MITACLSFILDFNPFFSFSFFSETRFKGGGAVGVCFSLRSLPRLLGNTGGRPAWKLKPSSKGIRAIFMGNFKCIAWVKVVALCNQDGATAIFREYFTLPNKRSTTATMFSKKNRQNDRIRKIYFIWRIFLRESKNVLSKFPKISSKW